MKVGAEIVEASCEHVAESAKEDAFRQALVEVDPCPRLAARIKFDKTWSEKDKDAFRAGHKDCDSCAAWRRAQPSKQKTMPAVAHARIR